MKPYPKGRQRRKLAATGARLDRIMLGEVPKDARGDLMDARNSLRKALKAWPAKPRKRRRQRRPLWLRGWE